MTEEIRNDLKKLEILKQMNHMIPDIEKRQINALYLNPVYQEQRFQDIRTIKSNKTITNKSSNVRANLLNGQDSNQLTVNNVEYTASG